MNTGTGTITIATSYYEGLNTRYNSLLLKATGTGDNNTFDDASTSNHTITGNGDVLKEVIVLFVNQDML